MADVRIKDLATTASAPASDDFLELDGATNGSRKFDMSRLNLPAIHRLFSEAIFLNDLTATINRGSTAYNPVDGVTVASNTRRRWKFSPVPGLQFNGDFVEDAQNDSATNRLLYSDDLTNAAWTKNNITVTANQMVSYDGVSLTMPKVEVATATTPYIEQSYTLTRSDATPTPVAAYVPVVSPGDVGALLFELTTDSGANGFRAWWIPSTGTWGTTSSLGTGVFQQACVMKERGHYRIWFRGKCGGASSAARLRVYLVDADNSTTSAAVGKYAFIHGFQSTGRSNTSVAVYGGISSHVVTTSVAVSRSDDSLYVALPSGDLNRVEGTILCYIRPAYWGQSVGGGYYDAPGAYQTTVVRAGLSNGAYAALINMQLGETAIGVGRQSGDYGTANQTNSATTSLWVSFPFTMIAITWRKNSVACWINGTKSGEDTSTPDYFDSLSAAPNSNGNLYLGGCGYQGSFYIPRALTAAELLLLARAGGFA